MREHQQPEYVVDDSGERETFASGMVRDISEGKLNPLLVRDGPMYDRWVQHLTAGAEKYEERNWMQADSMEEFERFLVSATRHFDEWLAVRLDEVSNWKVRKYFQRAPTREDSAAGVYFNVNGVEYVRDKIIEAQHLFSTESVTIFDSVQVGQVMNPPDPGGATPEGEVHAAPKVEGIEPLGLEHDRDPAAEW